MKLKTYILTATLFTTNLFSSPTGRQYVGEVGLQLNGTKYLTDKNGVFQPQQFLEVAVNDNVKIYRADGVSYRGKVTEIIDSPQVYKVYGELYDQPDCVFGFAALKNGTIAGVIKERQNKKTYTLEFSKEHKGYVFFQNFKFEGPEARLQQN